MVSIILICHNYGSYIQQCFNSIYANDQSLIREIIVINDSSEDNSSEIIEDNRSKNVKIKYFETNFRSLSKSYNFAVEKSNSNLVSKIDADDLYKENFLLDFFNYMSENELDLIYGDLLIQNENTGKQKIRIQKVPNFLRHFKYPVGSGTIFSKKLWEKVGGFDETLKFQDDYDFWLKVNKLKEKNIGYFNKVGYIHRKHKLNMSNNLFYKNIIKIRVFLKNC